MAVTEARGTGIREDWKVRRGQVGVSEEDGGVAVGTCEYAIVKCKGVIFFRICGRSAYLGGLVNLSDGVQKPMQGRIGEFEHKVWSLNGTDRC